MQLPTFDSVLGPVARAAGFAIAAACLALQAQAAALTIDTVVTAPGYVLPAGDTLAITAAGELNSPTAIELNGWLDNAGILRADMLTLGAIRVDNRAGARIEARELFSRAIVFNAAGATWVTGATPSALPAGGYFANSNSTYFSNSGEWLSHGDVSFQSSTSSSNPSFYNNGTFASQNLGASPYPQTMTLQPASFGEASGQPWIQNAFSMFIGNGTTLVNRGLVQNFGSMVVAGSIQGDNNFSRVNRRSGAFWNTGSLVIQAGGQFVQEASPTPFDDDFLTNTGTMTVNGLLHTNGPVHNRAGGGITIGPGGEWLFGGPVLNAAGSSLRVDGQVNGYGELANFGTVVVEATRQLAVRDMVHADGVLTVNGELANPDGRLTMTGGILNGNGTINGDVFIEGSGPPVAPYTNCLTPAPGSPCFNPGNSPGHMAMTGGLVLGSGAILQLELERAADGSLAWDTVTAAAMTFEAGSLVRVLISDFAGGSLLSLPQIQFLTCTSPGLCQLGAATLEVSGVFDAPNYPGGALALSGDGLSFALAPVPEPETWVLLLGGLGVVGWLARRAKRSA